MDPPPVRFDHLLRLTSPHGLLEHADHDAPRLDHGLCTDDNARALVVLCRAGELPAEVADAFSRYLAFVERGRLAGGGWHNRMDVEGRWEDRRGPDDAHGRALWGLGVAAAGAPRREWRERAAAAFAAGADLSSPFPRATAFAALGAAAAWHAGIVGGAAARLLERARATLPRPAPPPWRWPEERLTYANPRIAEALIVTGGACDDDAMTGDGVDLLAWLVDVETGTSGRFSFSPAAGRGPGESGPAFDQQPIEAWAMADACAAAGAVTGDAAWERRRLAAVRWFLGDNDSGAALYDAAAGAGYDGLTAAGINLNRGAESTLAALGALLSAEAPR